MRAGYPPEQIQFLRDQYPMLTLEELTAAFNAKFGHRKQPGTVLATLKNHKIRCGRKPGARPSSNRLLTVEQDSFLREHYVHMTREEVTAALNERFNTSFTKKQIVSYTKNHDVRCGRTGRWGPGNVPFNAGKAGTGICKPNAGSFKKGMTPHNHVPVGTVVTQVDGYKRIKVADPDQWEFMHRRTWEAAHGPIPDTHAVTFIDGNPDNCALENLECITRAELGVRNKYQVNSLPAELRPIAKTVAKIRIKSGELKRNYKKSRAA